MAKIVITTVGTSLLEKEDLTKVKGWLSNKMKNDIDKLLEGKALGQTEKDKAAAKYLSDATDLEEYPGEISSLKLMQLNKDEDRVKLLFSDTPDGTFCARANALYINKHFAKCDYNNDVIKINGLEVKEAQSFLNGLKNLKSLLEEIKEEAEKEDVELVFNITGGYKGIIPIISFFARKHKIALYYLYQDSDLIEIPPTMIVTSTSISGYQANKDLGPI